MILHKMVADYSRAKYAMLIIVVVLFASAIAACQPNQITPTEELVEPTDFPAGFPTPDPEIYAACLADGGRWEVLGFSGPGCNLPTSDGGKACEDSGDCESGCLGDPDLVMRKDEYGQFIPDHGRMDELNAEDGRHKGLCSPWIWNLGCQVWLEKGRYVAIKQRI